ncbi:MAG: hypothetical protein ABIG61_11815 [Planctomycetota bacterium]
MTEIVDFEDFNNNEATPDNVTATESTTGKRPIVNGNYITFATVDTETGKINWMDIVKPIIDPLEYKNEFNKEVLDDFVKSLGYQFLKREFPVINYQHHMFYAYDKYINKEEFLERFRWYFEENYPNSKPLTPQQKEFYRSLLLTADDKCKEIKSFGENLLCQTLNIVFFENHYYMVGTGKNEIMNSKRYFWNLGESQKEAKEYLVEIYLVRKYANKKLPYRYTNQLNEALHFYNLYRQAVSSLIRKLNLDYEEVLDLYDSLQSDFSHDGGSNSDSIVEGYWAHKMVKKDLKKYKSSGKID